MSDTLISPPVFIATSVIAAGLIFVATRRIGQPRADQLLDQTTSAERRRRLVPLMGVMGALIFAAQMLNFTIPATGSSGHIVGGVLLAAVLGPWAGFLTLTSILVVQCLLFADGGLMTLGCNVLNMAALSCLVAYPLVFKPLVRNSNSTARWATASIATSIVALAMGALAVTIETELSGITALPYGRFLAFMLPIHLLIGLGEGLATAAVIATLRRYRPELLIDSTQSSARSRTPFLAITAVVALLVATVAGAVASSRPDGLEWSIERTTQGTEIANAPSTLHQSADQIQTTTALMPDYEASMAGLVGVGATLVVIYGASLLIRRACAPLRARTGNTQPLDDRPACPNRGDARLSDRDALGADYAALGAASLRTFSDYLRRRCGDTIPTDTATIARDRPLRGADRSVQYLLSS